MSDMDDLISGEDIDQMLSEITDDPTVSGPFPVSLESENTRPSLKTPILSGKQMAGLKKHAFRQPEGTQRLYAASRDELYEDDPATGPLELSALSVDQVYDRAGLDSEASDAFTVYKVESMLEDESIAELDDHAKEAAVVMALKTHNVPMAKVVEDAIDRILALDAHDARLKDEFAAFETKVRDENERLQTEIDRFTKPRSVRIANNASELETFRRTYRDWFLKKEEEKKQLDRMIRRWQQTQAEAGLSVNREPVAPIRSTAHGMVDVPNLPEPGLGTADSEPVAIDYSFDDDVTIDSDKFVAVDGPVDFHAAFGQDSFEGAQTRPRILAPTNVAPTNVTLQADSSIGEEISEPSSVPLAPAPLPQFAPPSSDAIERPILETSLISIDDVSDRPRYPRTILQWLATITAIALWFVGSLLIASELEQIQAIAALGIAFVVPIVVALMMSMLTRGRGFAMGMIAWLAYSSIAMILFAHVSVDRLASVLLEDRYWIVDETPGFPPAAGAQIDAAAKWYGGLLVSNGLADDPRSKDSNE